jgi:gamma-glutamyltranspeptidase/glutathione hydrolase
MHGSHPKRGNQRGVPILLFCLLLAACSNKYNLGPDMFRGRSNLSGMAAADEPQAVLAGRDVLVAGGTAADAAVAMAFTMTLTYPSQVSLGSAGACLAYNHGQKKVEAIDFIPKPTGDGGMIPALPRGLFLLHANHGGIPWDRLLQPVQALAQRGVPASRAFIRQFTPFANELLSDPANRALFARPDGQPVAEGDLIRNSPLGIVIGRMASRGVGEFYGGTWAQEFATAAQQAGGTFSAAQLRSFAPGTPKPLSVEYGHEVAYFAPPPAMLGPYEAAAWEALAGHDTYEDAGKENRARVVADALAKTPAPTHDQTVGTGLVAVDGDGNAVACAFTLNQPFGMRHPVPGFGFALAAPQADTGVGMGPMITINPNSNEFRFAAASSGGVAGAKMVVRTALSALLDEKTVTDAVAEEAKADGVDRIAAARCLSGRPNIERCVAATDPRGFGLAQTMARR